uniref:Folate/biopterin transporter n=1 Tax=Erythrolobus madagascarensis TaxID=708628 RepID=A0A7S0T5G3_9RHOD
MQYGLGFQLPQISRTRRPMPKFGGTCRLRPKRPSNRVARCSSQSENRSPSIPSSSSSSSPSPPTSSQKSLSAAEDRGHAQHGPTIVPHSTAGTTATAHHESLLQLSPELAAILLVYFVQGVMGVSRLAVSFFLKDELALSPATVSAFTGIALIPWMIKPLYGFLTDALPLFGYRRRSYLVVSGLLGAASWALLSNPTAVDSAPKALACMTLASLSVAISDVVADSMVVERARNESDSVAGRLQSFCWGSSAIGGLISAYFSGYLLEHVTARQVFALSGALPLMTASVSSIIPEKRVTAGIQVVSGMKRLLQALRNRSVWMPTLFLFMWQATPCPETALFYFTTNELNFGPEFLGRVRVVASAAALCGVLVYQRLLSTAPIKNVLVGVTIAGVPLGLTQLLLVTHANRALGLDDKLFALADSAVLTVLGQVGFMPVLVLAARLCPAGVEATLFAALMSIYNAASATGNELGAVLTHVLGVTETNFDNLALLVTLCTLSSLLVLPFAGWIDVINENEENLDTASPSPSSSSGAATGAVSNLPQVLDVDQEEGDDVRSRER